MENTTVELKYAIPIIDNGEKKEIKFLKAGRLKVKHFELLPESLLAKSNEAGLLNLETKEMVLMFKELLPLIAGIFDIPLETAKEIDFQDIENVILCLENVFPKDEKKN